MDAGVDMNDVKLLRAAIPPETNLLVGIPCNEKFVNTEFTFSFPQLVLPDCRVGFYISGKDTVFDMREEIAEKAIQGGFTHCVMLDVDMVYPPLTILRLLASGKDIVNGFSVTRTMPHDPIYSAWTEDDMFVGSDGRAYVRTWPTDNNTPQGNPLYGAQRVNIVGGAALCIKTDVFRKLADDDPYKRFFAWEEGMGEDVYFSRRCDNAGYELYTIADLIVKHIATFSVVPSYNHELKTWGVSYDNSPKTEKPHDVSERETETLKNMKETIDQAISGDVDEESDFAKSLGKLTRGE